jgi:hypothetical protein
MPQVLLYNLGLFVCAARVVIHCGSGCFYCTCCYILWDLFNVLQVLLYIVGLVECTASVAIHFGIV